MNPREIHEDLDLSCSASGPSSWKILKFRGLRGLQLCNQ
ncbi:hypothetical protein TIFTF001_027647 [Ficus carica]|uniref:Uncharacterized protein n=1 Tax=Ficus carica TaxID=3494 RepID=A0AA88DGX3_FICCA|nr:hypothetical protein TIFTF001_025974 [Ficus carica]GMN58561.1 hypothetical protein TIFTF001_027647 [Ficus carica]